MSVHPSLKIRGNAQKRSVLSRVERLKLLLSANLWSEDKRVFGLPKTDPIKIKAKAKVK